MEVDTNRYFIQNRKEKYIGTVNESLWYNRTHMHVDRKNNTSSNFCIKYYSRLIQDTVIPV